MTLPGIVQNGVVVLKNGQHLPDGVEVDVVVRQHANEDGQPTLANLLPLAGTIDDLPEDMAEQHDHYIHGTPKK